MLGFREYKQVDVTILEALGKVAGVGGISLGVLTLVFKEEIEFQIKWRN